MDYAYYYDALLSSSFRVAFACLNVYYFESYVGHTALYLDA